jgi:hypothetical protein
MTEQLTDESQSLYFSIQAAWNMYKNQRGVPIGTNCAFPNIDILRQTPFSCQSSFIFHMPICLWFGF